MDKELKQFVKKLCKDESRTLVGRLCKQVEVLQNQPNLSDETKQTLNLHKSLLKEVIYENYRDLKNNIVFYLEGRSYSKLPIFNPNKDSNES